jgi:Na+-driven multidrug efflux pump
MISLCNQAIGLDEQKLAGEYLQIALLLSQILYIPQMVFWVYFVEDFILWL